MAYPKFIPVDNDLKKLIAFSPSLDKGWRETQRIKSHPFQVETLDALKFFQTEGWNIKGVYQTRGNDRRIKTHHVKLAHPDFRINNEAVATLDLSNSCNGSSPLNMDLGVWRKICSNGMMAHTSFSSAKINHTQMGFNSFQTILNQFLQNTGAVVNSFKRFQGVELDKDAQEEFAQEALKLRLPYTRGINPDQILAARRNEDLGSMLWNIYNVVQENIIKPYMLTSLDGKPIPGVSSLSEDSEINKQLYSLAEVYAN